MSDIVSKTLYRKAASIFEEMAFLLPIQSEVPIRDEPADGAAVAFTGSVQGSLILRITRDLLPVLSSNMLGEERTQDESMDQDALGEIANVICGNVLPALVGGDGIFNLESPRFFRGPIPDGIKLSNLKARVHMGLENGKAEVLLYTN